MRRLCDTLELPAGGSLRFPLRPTQGRYGPVELEGFVLRLPDGALRGYVNVCPHRGQAVDLGDGKLWAPDATLECSAHGAHFDALTGACVRGPCVGKGLSPLALLEHEGAVFLLEPAEEPVDDPEDAP